MDFHRIKRGLYQLIIGRFDPIRYAKKIGVNFGDNLHIYGKVSWSTEPWIIQLGNNVHITNGVVFITHDAAVLIFRREVPDLEITKPIIVGSDVYIGTEAIIMPGVHIGNRVIIGARAVVTKDVPDNSVVVGCPAKRIKSADEYFESAKVKSLHLGHLLKKEKDEALKKYYNYQGKSKGIYF